MGQAHETVSAGQFVLLHMPQLVTFDMLVEREAALAAAGARMCLPSRAGVRSGACGTLISRMCVVASTYAYYKVSFARRQKATEHC